jgi:hypothetical protein
MRCAKELCVCSHKWDFSGLQKLCINPPTSFSTLQTIYDATRTNHFSQFPISSLSTADTLHGSLGMKQHAMLCSKDTLEHTKFPTCLPFFSVYIYKSTRPPVHLLGMYWKAFGLKTSALATSIVLTYNLTMFPFPSLRFLGKYSSVFSNPVHSLSQSSLP